MIDGTDGVDRDPSAAGSTDAVATASSSAGADSDDEQRATRAMIAEARAVAGPEPEAEPEAGDDQGIADDGLGIAERANAALDAAIDFYHEHVDDELPDGLEHETPRDYFRARGWSDETIDSYRLGYAPADPRALGDYLRDRGFDPDAIRGTGLFWDRSTPVWRGRVVLPYLVDGRARFAISRALGHAADRAGAGADDDGPAKYHKIPNSDDDVYVKEPIFGLETVRSDSPVLITEGIADAITAQQYGYPCVSPVTIQFRLSDRKRLADELGAADVPRVYLIQDAERPTSDINDRGKLRIEQHGEGTRGAVRTGAFLTEHGIPAFVGELPLLSESEDFHKVDLDDYLSEWARDGDLWPIIASAKPAYEHPAYDSDDAETGSSAPSGDESNGDGIVPGSDGPAESRGDAKSALYDLEIGDVASTGGGYRGPNPLGDHGDSSNYTKTFDGDGGETLLYDHKYKSTYNALTFLLCNAGVRNPDRPKGSLSDKETFKAWKHAKKELGVLPDNDPIPHRALLHIAIDVGGYCDRDELEDGWRLPRHAYVAAVDYVRDELEINPGREIDVPTKDELGLNDESKTPADDVRKVLRALEFGK